MITGIGRNAITIRNGEITAKTMPTRITFVVVMTISCAPDVEEALELVDVVVEDRR